MWPPLFLNIFHVHSDAQIEIFIGKHMFLNNYDYKAGAWHVNAARFFVVFSVSMIASSFPCDEGSKIMQIALRYDPFCGEIARILSAKVAYIVFSFAAVCAEPIPGVLLCFHDI